MNKAHGPETSVIGAGIRRRRDQRLSWIVLPFLLAGIASTEVHAAPTGLETTGIRVRYERRELTSPAAARNLLRRIGDAALESCGASSFSLAEFKTAIVESRCWKDAVDDAVRRIGNPVLSAAASESRR
ncbi:MAG TPA: UrcA family protein [Steroidobacteraceae bacterium]|nr:UrcA family protein [Steroidobacteraceae bacterium]